MSVVSVIYIATVVFYFLEHILNSDILQNCNSGKKLLYTYYYAIIIGN